MTRRAQRSARSQSRKTPSSYSPPPAEILSCLHPPQPPHEVEEEKAKPTRTRARPRSKTISALPSSSSSSFPSSPPLSSSAPTEHREGRRKEYLSPSPSRRRHRRSSSRSRSRSPSRSPSLGRKRDGERRHKREYGHRRRHRNKHQERERRQGRAREEKLDAFSSLRHLERELEVMIAAEKERCRLKEINAELEYTESAEADQSWCREDKKANELTLKQQEEEANCGLPYHLKEEWRYPFEGVSPLAAPLWQPQRDSSVLLVAPSFSLPPLLSLPPLTPSPALPFYEGISFNSDLTLRPLQEERAEAAEREGKTQFGQAIDEWNSSYVSVLEEEQQAEQQISTEPSDKEEEEQVREQEPTTITTKRKHDRVIDDVTTSSKYDTEIISSSSSASQQLLPKMKKARLVPQDEEHVSSEKKHETSNKKESSLLSIGTLSGIVVSIAFILPLSPFPLERRNRESYWGMLIDCVLSFCSVFVCCECVPVVLYVVYAIVLRWGIVGLMCSGETKKPLLRLNALLHLHLHPPHR
ncbi:PHD and RING finger domain-containing protein 1 [Balamuthia mandrillaris]